MKRTILVVAIVALALLTSGFTIRRVFFDNSAVATGYLQPASVAQLNFAATGAITAIHVHAGDTVKAGQVLASQDTKAIEAQLAAHQAALAADQAAIQFHQNPLRPQEAQALELAVVAAQGLVGAAQTKAAETFKVDNTLATTAANEAQATRDTLAADQQNAARIAPACGSLLSTITPSGSSVAPTGDAARPTDSPITHPPATVLPTDQALLNACNQIAHQIAQDQAGLTQAGAAYDQAVAKRQLNARTLGTDVTDAQRQLDVAVNQNAVGLLPSTPATVAQAQAAVTTDNVAVAADRASLAAAMLVAPADGVVADIGAIVGEIAGPEGVRLYGSPQALPEKDSSGIQLFPQPPKQQTQQQSQFKSLLTLNSVAVKVVAQLNEGDLHAVTSDTYATITFPALPGQSFKARIEHVQPQAVNINGSVYFLVDLALPTQPPTAQMLSAGSGGNKRQPSAIPLSALVVGLTANVRF
jgi:multidrug efflux pump subunit AcrA (membrane-fusion protein)